VQTKQSAGIVPHTRLTMGAIAFMTAAGVIHLALVPQHWSHSPAHGLALAVMGLLEIAWSVAFWRAPSAVKSRLGLVTALGLIFLWAITRVAVAPFGHGGPEEIDAWGVISKLCEGLAAAALVPLAMSPGNEKRRWRTVAAAAAAAVIGAWATYGVALAAEPLLPACDVASAGDHQDHHHDEHQDHGHGH